MSELKQVMKELNFHQNLVDCMFLKPPKGNFSRVNIFGEISSLSEFPENNLYLFYEFALPIGWKVDNENDDYLLYQSENIVEENINKLKSISQVSAGYVNPGAFSFVKPKNYSFTRVNNTFNETEDELKDTHSLIHNFSLPFELELLGHNDAIGKFDPKLLIQINSLDYWGRHRIEGYCFINLPIKTGYTNLNVPCFKPQEDNYMKIFSYFLGGSRKIPDLKELAKSASSNELNVDTVLNRYGIMTEYTGTVHVNYNCVIQKESVMTEARNEVKNKQGIEDYNLLLGIHTALGEKVATIKYNTKQGQMQTTNHGLINRYEN